MTSLLRARRRPFSGEEGTFIFDEAGLRGSAILPPPLSSPLFRSRDFKIMPARCAAKRFGKKLALRPLYRCNVTLTRDTLLLEGRRDVGDRYDSPPVVKYREEGRKRKATGRELRDREYNRREWRYCQLYDANRRTSGSASGIRRGSLRLAFKSAAVVSIIWDVKCLVARIYPVYLCIPAREGGFLYKGMKLVFVVLTILRQSVDVRHRDDTQAHVSTMRFKKRQYIYHVQI